MKSENKQKTIHYKNVFITGDENLQLLIKSALNPAGRFSRPNQRQQMINGNDSASLFINRFGDHNGMTYGQLVVLESGRRQPYITVDDSADFYSIDALASDSIPADKEEQSSVELQESKQTAARKRREFVESILYFGVVDCHLVLMQSKALGSRELEAHLAWLLGSCAGVMPDNSALILKDKPAEAVARRMEANPVKKIRIGSDLTTEVYNDPSEPRPARVESVETEEVHANKVRFTPTGRAAALLRAALPDGFLERLALEDSLDEANIHVALEVTYSRTTTKVGQRVIDQVAGGLRHLPEADVNIELKGGGRIRGDELKLSGPIKVKFMENGLIDESVLVHEMHQWLLRKIAASEIDSTSQVSD